VHGRKRGWARAIHQLQIEGLKSPQPSAVQTKGNKEIEPSKSKWKKGGGVQKEWTKGASGDERCSPGGWFWGHYKSHKLMHTGRGKVPEELPVGENWESRG